MFLVMFQGCTRVLGTNLISCRSQNRAVGIFPTIGSQRQIWRLPEVSQRVPWKQVPTQLAGAYPAETLPPIIMVQWTMDDGCISNRIFIPFSNFSYFPLKHDYGRKSCDEQLSKRWKFSLLNNEQRWATGWGWGWALSRLDILTLGVGNLFFLPLTLR